MQEFIRIDERRDALLKYVQKSNLVLNMLPKVNPDDPKLQATKDAILQGDFEAQVFSDPDCHLYIVYLIQNKLVSYSEGVTAYIYLIILMSYSSKQPLKPEDAPLKRKRSFSTVPLVKINPTTQEKELTLDGISYLENLYRWMEAFNKSEQLVNKESIINFLFDLPPMEQSLIKLELNMADITPTWTENRLDFSNLNLIGLTAPIIGFAPFNSQLLLSMPSVSAIDYMLRAMKMNSPNVTLPLYGMGIVSQETLYELQQKFNLRFSALYSPGVKKNLLEGHLNKREPFEILFHDIYHCVVSNLGYEEEKALLDEVIIPMLYGLTEECAQTNNDLPRV